eukprot:scaffold31118_cov22-Tisochrysis_lutea.AAC.1
MQEQCTAGSPKRGAWAATARHRANLRVRCLLAPAVVDHAAAVWCFAPVAMDHAARKDAKSGMLRVLAKVWYFATFVVNHVAPSEECLARSMCLQRSWCFATFAVDHAAPSEANPGVLNVHARGVLSAPPLVDHAAPNKPCKGIIHWYGKGVHTQEDLLMQLLTGLSSKYSQMHSAVTCAGSSFIRGNCLHVCVCACVPRAFGRSLHAWVISAHHVAPDAAEVECVLWCACVVALLLLRLEHVESMRTVLSELLKLPGEDAEEEGGGMVLTPVGRYTLLEMLHVFSTLKLQVREMLPGLPFREHGGWTEDGHTGALVKALALRFMHAFISYLLALHNMVAAVACLSADKLMFLETGQEVPGL